MLTLQVFCFPLKKNGMVLSQEQNLLSHLLCGPLSKQQVHTSCGLHKLPGHIMLQHEHMTLLATVSNSIVYVLCAQSYINLTLKGESTSHYQCGKVQLLQQAFPVLQSGSNFLILKNVYVSNSSSWRKFLRPFYNDPHENSVCFVF